MSDVIPKECSSRQYHDSDLSFNWETMVFFSQCDAVNKNLNLNELLKLTSDVAVEDFNRRGMSREVLNENGIAILVSRDSFRFHKFPKENQKIVVRTWEEKSEPLQFVRAVEIESLDGEKLVSGITAWLLIDLNQRRIMPIKKFDSMGLRTPTEKKTEHDCLPFRKIQIPEDMTLWDERVIKYTDLDANGHTNNSRYAAFAVDALPEQFQSKVFKDFRINFAKEAMLGQKVQVFGKIEENENKLFILGKAEGETSFEVELCW